MSDHKLAEALRGLVHRVKREQAETLNEFAWSEVDAAEKALAAHEAEQQAGEAVAYLNQCRKKPELRTLSFEPDLSLRAKGFQAIPLTHPQQPLTDEQIDQIVVDDAWDDNRDKNESFGTWCIRFARAIESAHGITKDTK